MKKTPTKTAARRPAGRNRHRGRARKAKAVTSAAPPAPEVIVEPIPEPSHVLEEAPLLESEIIVAEPERQFAARVPPPEPERPRPRFAAPSSSTWRTRAGPSTSSGPDAHGARPGRGLDRARGGRELARDRARHGPPPRPPRRASRAQRPVDGRARLERPSHCGRRGVWLAAARPGDTIEIVTDDQAFDAVGDVAASLGVHFRRLSYRGLVGATAGPEPTPEPARPAASDSRGRHRRRGRRRNWHESGAQHALACTGCDRPDRPARAGSSSGTRGACGGGAAPHECGWERRRASLGRAAHGAPRRDHRGRARPHSPGAGALGHHRYAGQRAEDTRFQPTSWLAPAHHPAQTDQGDQREPHGHDHARRVRAGRSARREPHACRGSRARTAQPLSPRPRPSLKRTSTPLTPSETSRTRRSRRRYRHIAPGGPGAAVDTVDPTRGASRPLNTEQAPPRPPPPREE